ncbi:DNA-directed RNA polymerase subunit beta' [Paracholeplasma manati]|jgi:DNA-directed RNA polymerase subunit beta'|uniref:DNA-directed RNA polymerase subunit beta' n=1 Tax=Paracholeplasma manati TaxID=591373 RepID=UPI00240867DE|nr:DNA-directed RNA polymerase subunit beta' [Paracholeplasma manati]MDG0888584.1 DNA-directed RNA polymerase subunit beta' [Paracholeplasma manati]MDX9807287.1 DNA-directed RNA polymerase subunit beta' [Acholeplasma sp.]
MAKDNKKVSIVDLKLSAETTEYLTLSGIDTLEDFNTFTLKELRLLLKTDAAFNEVVPVLKKYVLPSAVENLALSKELGNALNDLGIVETKALLALTKEALHDIINHDGLLYDELAKLFNMYGVLLPDKEDLVHDHHHDEDLVQDVDAEVNINTPISVDAYVKAAQAKPKNKAYGSTDYSHLKIRLASPEEIRSWSYGEVLKHETINYRTLKPEEGGLFCERIFGPTKDYQCLCGKKRNLDKGQICDKCGVEITESKVRRERMGHIELEAPVVHTWYLKNSPSRLALLLDIKAKDLEEVVYLASYIVTDPGDTPLSKKQILSEMEYNQYYEQYGNKFKAMTGAEAVKKLLQDIDLDKEVKSLRRKLKSPSKQKRDRVIKRLEVVEAFNNSDNKPEWMVLDVLPVIPPDIRPMVALDGGRFATTDLNDLYRRILNRNNRLKRQKEQNAPRLIMKNEKRMLQEAVDALIDNAKRGKKAVVERNRHLKSLSDMLRGKQGRFRQNLLGKRVDFSGRSVIIVGPDLEMYQCGIPREMAIILFKPFVLRELTKRKETIQAAKRSYEALDDDAWSALEAVVVEHPVLLNRAPTLHRLGIQAFEPKLIEGKAIRLHPLVTTAFNADFDGDQMAVHVPLSHEAQAEARLLMLASNNILNPKDGKPVVTPSQDMVLGNYYLTMSKRNEPNEGHFYTGYDEAYMAYKNGEITLHTLIVFDPKTLPHAFTEEQRNAYLVTTLGKAIFNQILPPSFPFLNEPTSSNLIDKTPDKYFVKKGLNVREIIKEMPLPKPFDKKYLSLIIAEVFKQFQINETSKMLDRLKDLGFKYSTVAGITVSASDMVVYTKKQDRLKQAEEKIAEIDEYFDDGVLTESERKKLVVNEWKVAGEDIQAGVMSEFDTTGQLFIIFDSGARGNKSHFSQLLGMRGLMTNPTGETIEIPVKANFREGLSVSEFFISTHGARKGSTDTALKTAESGYLTRRLVDVSQDVIVDLEDCQTEKGVVMEAIRDNDGKETVSLFDRIIGRYASSPVIHPTTKEVLVDRNQLITNELGEVVVKAGVKSVEIRSVLTCNSVNGVCKLCYGRNLATNKSVEVGEAVGVIAAQSIGEPGTQLTMRTFHTGGVASASDITAGLPRIQELFEARKPKGVSVISEVAGKVKMIETSKAGSVVTVVSDQTLNGEPKEYKYTLDSSAQLLVKKNQVVKAGDRLNKGSIHPKELLRVSSAEAVEKYIVEEAQKVYRAQGVEISDKHFEIIVHQMLRKISVIFEGDTELLPGSKVSIAEFKAANKKAIAARQRPAVGQPELLGITRASLQSDSFLSAASFQETTRILTDAAIHGKTDELHGLKENVIIGGLIPAGTGILKDKFFHYEEPVIDDEEFDQA